MRRRSPPAGRGAAPKAARAPERRVGRGAAAQAAAPASRPAIAAAAARAFGDPWPPEERVSFPASRPAMDTASLFPPRTPFPTTRPAPENAIAFPARTPFPTTRPEAAGAGIGRRQGAGPLPCGQQIPDGRPATKWGFRPEMLFREQGGGTALRLLLSSPDLNFIDLDPRGVKIDRFVDDTGHELSTALAPEYRNGYGYAVFAPFGWSNVSTDGHNALFRVALEDAPAADATRFALRGSAEVHVGVNEQTAEQKDLPVEVGSSIKAGPVTLTVKSISSQYNPSNNPGAGPPAPEAAPVLLVFSSTHEPRMIRKIEFFDADGRPVSSNFSWQPPPFGSDPNYRPAFYTCQCFLGHDLGKAAVKVTYFDRVESATVPIQIVAGVGL